MRKSIFAGLEFKTPDTAIEIYELIKTAKETGIAMDCTLVSSVGFWEYLKGLDWTYEYSDDINSWRRGSESMGIFKYLLSICPDAQKVYDIYKQWGKYTSAEWKANDYKEPHVLELPTLLAKRESYLKELLVGMDSVDEIIPLASSYYVGKLQRLDNVTRVVVPEPTPIEKARRVFYGLMLDLRGTITSLENDILHWNVRNCKRYDENWLALPEPIVKKIATLKDLCKTMDIVNHPEIRSYMNIEYRIAEYGNTYWDYVKFSPHTLAKYPKYGQTSTWLLVGCIAIELV